MTQQVFKTKPFNMRISPELHATLLHIQEKYKWSNKELLVHLYENLKFLYCIMGDKFSIRTDREITSIEKEKITEIAYMVR